MTPPTLEAATIAVQQLPHLTSTTRQLLDYLNDDSVDLKVIVRAIECDQGLAIRILRVANSPFFGMPNKIQSINDAVVVVGFSNLRMIVIAAMTTALKFPNLGNDPGVLIQYRHSLSVAICASVLARNNNLDASALFLAGLLHDIGKLALMSAYPVLYQQTRQLARDEDLFPVEAETRVFGFDHADIGASLCRHWNLPESIVEAIGGHHVWSDADTSAVPLTTADLYSGVIHLADAIALALNLEHSPYGLVPPVSDRVWTRLAGRQEGLERHFAEIQSLYQELVVLIES